MEQKQTVEEAAKDYADNYHFGLYSKEKDDAHVRGFKAGAEWAASLPTNSMQWVGASERLPEMKRYYNCKLQGLPVAFWIDKKNDAIVNNKGDEMPKILWDQIFWLDESAPTEPNGQ